MTTQTEAQELLDSMLIPFTKNKRSITANKELSTQEIDILYDIVINFENNSGKYNYEQALQAIATIMKKFLKDSEEINGKQIVRNPATMPFLIKQVLFFIAVSCIEHKISAKAVDNQKYILDKLNSYLGNTPVSHNFFSKMHNTPIQYVQMKRYKQPKILHISYLGQKNGDLAIAIKNLVYQSGKYDIFCDIFGGSGAALLSVDRRKDSKYVYNELSPRVYNLFCVLVDDNMYKELITELNLLQEDLRGNGVWLDEGYDFATEIQQFFNSRLGNRTESEISIKEDGAKDFELPYDDIVNDMQIWRGIISNEPASYTVTFDGTVYDRAKLLKEIFPDKQGNTSSSNTHREGYACFLSFIKNFRLIKELITTSFASFTSTEKKMKNGGDMHVQSRFYLYYAYFTNLLNNKNWISSGEEVRCAVAEIFLRSLTTHGSVDVSAILRMLCGSNSPRKKATSPKNFLKKDFEDIIPKVHELVRGTICESEDCIAVIDKYKHTSELINIKHNRPLFYSDSPYSGTKGYSKTNGVPPFTPDKMKDLILALSNSEDKFIFSCRAIKDVSERSKSKNKVGSINQDIFGNVFEYFVAEFFEKKKKLWVLAIEKSDEALKDLVENNKIAEIMITNFEIVDFKKVTSKSVFKVYTFEEFLQILIDNANV